MSATPELVRNITGSTLSDVLIQPFVTASAAIIAKVSADMTEPSITQAEGFLAAHILTISSVGASSKTITKESLRGEYLVEYATAAATGQGVLSTHHGQTANMLTDGALAELGKQPAMFYSIGTTGDDY